jgi:3-phenylpropionate/trans-cinnamate dioxygenase ferredoxin reductase subunit
VGDEPIVPYQRPPLSKAWLKGEADAASLALKPDDWYPDNNIALRLSQSVQAIDPAAHTVELSSGETLAYRYLILAMGARARQLTIPGSDLANILELRTAADAEALKSQLGPGKTLAVIGGGYVGLEAAASARALGAEAVVIEREDRILARVACKELSDFFTGYHQAKGVRFDLAASVQSFTGKDGKVTGVQLEGGQVIACDVALVGIGAIPNDDAARAAGLDCGRGIIVDLDARTSAPDIFAIGDVTERPLPLYERTGRLESVPNALEQAKQAASAIVGKPGPPSETPWFWSDQYDLKLQIAGMPFDSDHLVIRGDPETAKFAVFHLKGDVLQCVEAVNSAPEYMMGRQLIGNRKPISEQKLADPSISMKEVAV